MMDEGKAEAAAAAEKTSLLRRLHGEWLEIISAILLALATVASAWCAYQASRWGHQETLRLDEATALRIQAADLMDMAETDLDIDVGMFLDYLDAWRAGNLEAMSDFETNLFREEMRRAVEAWKAADPLGGPGAPGTPFEMPEYVNAKREESEGLEEQARREISEAKRAVRISDFHILLTVVYASVLFFAGICTKFKAPWLRVSVLAFGAALFVASTVVMILRPVA